MSARPSRPVSWLAALACGVASIAVAVEPRERSVAGDGVGAFKPEYVVPAPGTYELPPIQTVGDHAVLDEDGRETSFFDVVGDRIAIVAFIYTSCIETNGCPLSTATLQRLDGAIASDDTLRDRVTLVSLSFDPDRDTPSRMRERRDLHAPKSRWRFLTTRNPAMLAPVLTDFGQQVAKLQTDDGAPTSLYRHVLKVFLIDERHRVRNIYSAAYLHSELILSDVRTLLMTR